MISRIFSTQSLKAWIAGALGTLLTPLFALLQGDREITLRDVGIAVGTGLVTAIATYAVPNKPGPLPWQPPLEPETETFAVPSPRETQEIPRIDARYVDEYGRHAR